MKSEAKHLGVVVGSFFKIELNISRTKTSILQKRAFINQTYAKKRMSASTSSRLDCYNVTWCYRAESVNPACSSVRLLLLLLSVVNEPVIDDFASLMLINIPFQLQSCCFCSLR